MSFSLPSIKCLVAPPSVGLLQSEQQSIRWAQFRQRNNVRQKSLPNIWLTVVKNAFVGWTLNFRVCMLLKGAINASLLSSYVPVWLKDNCRSQLSALYVSISCNAFCPVFADCDLLVNCLSRDSSCARLVHRPQHNKVLVATVNLSFNSVIVWRVWWKHFGTRA